MGKMKEIFMEQRENEDSFSPVSEIESQIIQNIKPTSLTKKSSEDHAQAIAEMVWGGHASALDMATKLQWIISVCETARKKIQNESVDEIMKHSGPATINGAKVEKTETGISYDYASSGDSEWERYDQMATSAAASKKERETFLKALTKPMTIVNDDSGEIHEIKPPQKTSSTNIKITFPGQ